MTSNTQDLAKKYQKKTDKQHILDNPDTYIGSVENIDEDTYIYDSELNSIVEKHITYVPAVYKLFDEGIVNCRDHTIRMKQLIKPESKPGEKNYPVTNIDVTISDDGIITLYNDGNGIDICKHPEYDVWIPELIFGHLRTSTNYDKNEKKTVGGKNGFGFKLVLIWSTWGKIETVDHKTGQKYTQEFHDNLNTIDKPKITKCKNKPYTSVSFKPDYKRLNIPGIDADFKSLLLRRIYDMAAVTDKSVKVKFNSKLIEVKSFINYVDLYIGDKNTTVRVQEQPHERWEYAVCIAPKHEFTQISFVNGIFTSKGGKHVDYITNQIIRKITAYIKQNKKIDVKPSAIKEQLMVFINCTIENPAFDSQTKDCLNTAVSNFGSSCEVSDKFIEKLAKMGVMATACSITEVKDNKAVKKTDGTKVKNIRNIPKLVDANFAGTSKSAECVIILCEGDSAKSGIISGLSSEDRNYIGVYPMKGKMFNVRGESASKISVNKEIFEIKQIVGLEHGKKYTAEDVKTKLRYGKILFMTDQDLDGSHIKGLGINMIDSEWKSLINIPDFIGYMNTPILKATKGKEIVEFYNEGQFESWKKENDASKWHTKYYKGLGTSTSIEFKEYFQKKKIVNFTSSDKCSDLIDMVFNKKRAHDRKDWLTNYDRTAYLDTDKTSVTYEEFIHNDLRHFSTYDNDRSIPNICDGLKISLRKILYSAFKKKLHTEIKVAQFSGYVSEHSGYHHGEASLNGAIVGLAQNFVGSNNINLFKPKGQFGTRLMGGKDAASERYIFTQLSDITRAVFPEIDDKVLTYLKDDGDSVEPVYYVPIIPMILINGTKGIGTGFSTDIMSHNPIQIIQYLENKLNDKKELGTINPYYKNFKGSILPCDKDNKYLIRGVYELIDDTHICITELPIGTWTQTYKEFLETLLNSKDKNKCYIKDYTDLSTDINILITVQFYPGIISKLLGQKHDNGLEGVEHYLKLSTTQSTTNMHLFNPKGQLTKYDTIYSIMDEYYSIRLEYYNKRKAYLIELITKELVTLSNKTKYITELLNDTIDLRKKSKDQIYTLLEGKNFDKDKDTGSYNYLIKMPMDCVSEENIEKLSNEHNEKQNELDKIRNSKIQDLWLGELANLKILYNEFLLIEDIAPDIKNKKSTGKSKGKSTGKSAAK
jgi:DNA topoisomerase-2